MSKIDTDMQKLVSEHGIPDTIAALARYCHARGSNTVFRRLNKIYEWLREHEPK